MKILKITALVGLFTIMTGCDPYDFVLFVNQSNKNIYVMYYVSNYPDTIIVDSHPSVNNKYIAVQDTSLIFKNIVPFVDYDDTVSVFVLDADTVNHYTWDTVIKYNMVLQRYDLSFSDYSNLIEDWCYCFLCFPPNENMRYIHMWPPYGTYDEYGRKKKP